MSTRIIAQRRYCLRDIKKGFCTGKSYQEMLEVARVYSGILQADLQHQRVVVLVGGGRGPLRRVKYRHPGAAAQVQPLASERLSLGDILRGDGLLSLKAEKLSK